MIPDRLVAAFSERLGLQSFHVRSQESTYFRKKDLAAGSSSARGFRFCVLVEGASVAQCLTFPSVSGLCLRE